MADETTVEEVTPVENIAAEGAPVQSVAHAEGAPAESKPAESVPAESASADNAASTEGAPAEEKPRRRTRRSKAAAAEEAPQGEAAPEAPESAPAEGEGESAPRKRTRTRRKPKAEDETAGTQMSLLAEAPAEAASPEAGATDAAPEDASAEEATAERPRRGRRRKVQQAEATAESLDIEEMTRMTQAATVATGAVIDAPASTLAEADARMDEAQEGTAADQGGTRRRHKGAQQGQQNQPGQQGQQNTQGQQQDQMGAGSSRKRSQKNRRNRRGQEMAAEPTLTREELEAMKVAELRAKAAELGVDHAGMRKAALVEEVYVAAARAEGFRQVEGVLDMQNDGYAILRTGNYMKGDDDAFVHQQVVRSYGLRPGDYVVGTVGPARSGNKYPPLQRIERVNGRLPEELRHRPRFRDLTPIYPDERLVMEHGKDSITGRAIDLVAPIGKGQRGLIVSPPKAGKTTVLKHICQSIAANNPEVHLFCLLVDERPEEVTDMERSVRGTVVASTFDMPADNHTAVAELVIEHAKRLVELGEDVVVVLDSITRLARAYNLAQPASGRILSGGVDSAALYPPKKFLGAARNIEHGGSLTILASALVDTGSKMDEVIFEEFKGTGNMELKLDRDLADKRVFPAIDPVSSGTRNEDLLITPDMQPFVWGIRRVLANMNNMERAATALVKGLKATNTNEEFLIRSAKKAQQSDYAF